MTAKVLKFLPLLPAILAVVLWGASFNAGRPDWETTQRVLAIGLAAAALALAVFAIRTGRYEKLSYGDLGNSALTFAGFVLLTMSEVNGIFRGVGIVALISGIFRLQKGGTEPVVDVSDNTSGLKDTAQ